MRVYKDMVVFERRDFHFGGKVGPDLVLPLGHYEPKPFSARALEEAFGLPAFAKDAKPKVAVLEDAVTLEIPAALANDRARVYLYDIVIVGDEGKDAALRKCVYAAGCDFAQDCAAARGPTKVVVSRSELPKGRMLMFAVRPVSSLGTAGRAISVSARIFFRSGDCKVEGNQ